jgi:hypothetical protein
MFKGTAGRDVRIYADALNNRLPLRKRRELGHAPAFSSRADSLADACMQLQLLMQQIAQLHQK